MKNIIKLSRVHSRWFCVVLALLCTGTAFAQARTPAAPAPAPARPAPAQPAAPAASASASSAKQNAISFLDVMPLVKGLLASNEDADTLFVYLAPSYERRIASHMSIGGEINTCFGKVGKDADGDDIPYLYFSMAAVWRYYMTEQIDKFFVGAMFGFNVQSIDGKTKEENGGFTGPLVGVNFGYKAMLGKTFFLEPSMAYIYSKYNGGPTPLGWQGGLRIGIAF